MKINYDKVDLLRNVADIDPKGPEESGRVTYIQKAVEFYLRQEGYLVDD